MMILPQGATSPIAFYLACIPVGIAASLATITPPDAPSARRSFNVCFGFAIILAAYVLFQAWSFPGNPFANPIWAEADMLVGVATRAISVEPSTTAMATITLLSPFLLYASSLAFFDSDKRALGLVKLIAAISIAFAVFGLVQIWFLPHSLLLSRKIYYLDSLTSVFVNRNTAGTFLGVASLAVLAQIVAVIQEIEHPAPLRRLLSLDDKEISDQRLRGGLWVVGLIACLLALFLTRSRGALLSTLVAYISAMPLLAAHLAGRFRRFGGATEAADASKRRWKAFSRTMIVAAIVLFVAALLGGRALLRLEQHPVDEARLCVYASAWKAFLDHWFFGTGLGTFESVFPSYRLPDCGGFYVRFGRTHSFYLEGLVGLGIVFIPALLAAYAHVFSNFLRGYRTRRSLRYVPIIGFSAALLVTLHGAVDFSLQIPGMASLFAVFLGAVTTVSVARGEAVEIHVRRPSRHEVTAEESEAV
jgi:O-antigen ligase